MAGEFTPEHRRVLNSANHTEREKMLDECKRKFDTARDEFLASKGISEEELLKLGYSKKTWTSSTEDPFLRDWHLTVPKCDDYPVYLGLTGEKICDFTFTSDKFEEERMIDIGCTIAGMFNVHPKQVALTKELCKDGGCKILVSLRCDDGHPPMRKRMRHSLGLGMPKYKFGMP